jgi:hypothetical protein
MDLNQLADELDRYPVVVRENLLALGFLSDIEIVTDGRKFRRKLDQMTPMEGKRYIIIDPHEECLKRFPVIKPSFNPFCPELNDALFRNYSMFQKLVRTQRDVPSLISKRTDVDVIVLIIIDGLSYADCRDMSDVEPCMVDGLTVTKIGYRNVVGSPTIGERLFQRGFANLFGFTYWTREDDAEISNRIFVPFGFEGFSEILDRLSRADLLKTYIQIVMAGLDETAHKSRDEPLIEPIVERIFNRVHSIENLIIEKQRTGIIYLTADHGILWKHRCELQHINDPANENASTRYFYGRLARQYVHFVHRRLRLTALPITSYGRNYSMLKFPYITRTLRNNEWGVHGGISYQECFVPFLKREIERC